MNIQWWPRARAALSNILPRSEAEAIDRAVQEWARSGAGYVIHCDGESHKTSMRIASALHATIPFGP